MAITSPSRWAGIAVLMMVLALGLVACGPESGRPRNGGTGGSARPDAPATKLADPALVVLPTARQPYASEGPLPTLRPVAPAAPAATPATPRP